MTRRGFTLVEILIGLVIASIVGGAVYKVLVESQRITRTLNARVDTQQSARTAALYLSTALREVAASEGDIITATNNTVVFRAMRWTGMTCTNLAVAGNDLTVVLNGSQFWGYRGPDTTTDSLLVYVENDVETRADDAWLFGGLMNVGAGTCVGGAAGTLITFRISAGSGGNAAALAGFTRGSPVRGFQHEELSLYTDAAGKAWLGYRTRNAAGAWTAIEPLVGPLAPNGLALTYFDTLGTATTALNRIASVGVVIQSESMEAARTGAGSIGNLRDSIVTRIAVRNNRRF